MKKNILIIMISCVICMFFSSCGNNTSDNLKTGNNTINNSKIELTLENYKQYLSVSAKAYSGDDPYISCNVKPLTSNYDFNDVKITVRTSGQYTTHNKVFTGYSSPGVPHYDCTIKFSEEEYQETFNLMLSIGGELITDGSQRKDITLPEGDRFDLENYSVQAPTTINSGNISCVYEVISISGTISK